MVRGKREATAILKIRGMGDTMQARRFRRTATRLDGVLRVDFDYILDSVTVKYDADKLTPAQIKKRLALRQHAPVIRGRDSGGVRGRNEHVTTAE